MRTHQLKTWPEPFTAVFQGLKYYEVRVDDRGFAVGDELILQEYDPTPGGGGFSGREVRKTITYMTPGGSFGLPPNLCILGLSVLSFSKG